MANSDHEILKKILALEPKTVEELQTIKRRLAKEHKIKLPSVTQLLKSYRLLVAQQDIQANEAFEKLLQRRSVRTISGIAPITVLTKPYPCPGKCIYCPTEASMPKSYLSNEPAAMRALLNSFDPYKQVFTRLESLCANGHPVDKLELIVKGGTWGSYPWPYELWFIIRCYEAANDFKPLTHSLSLRERVKGEGSPDPSLTKDGYLPKNLELYVERLLNAQQINEKTGCRIIGLTLETRPDWIDIEKIQHMRRLGATRVEVGLQHTDDTIQELTQRGHTLVDTIKATQLLRNSGFKVDFHTMPQLPGATVEKDYRMYQELFTNPGLRPDMIKVYPCVVVPQADLYQWWKEGKYSPYPDIELLEMLIKVKSTIIPSYVRISRLIRDIPSTSVVSGNGMTNLRQVIQKEMKKRGLKCLCLRCRELGRIVEQNLEIKQVVLYGTPKLFEYSYEASEGTEYFLSFEDSDRYAVFGFLRLRLPPKQGNELLQAFPELHDAAFIRELHTYGPMVVVGEESDVLASKVQHSGLGKKLMTRAEEIAKQTGYKKMAVIAGVGVREYYRKIGYRLEGTYMTKSL